MAQSPAGSNPSFDNYGQASVALNIPVKTLRKCKKAGCPAFRGTRIYKDDFLPWWVQNKSAIEADSTPDVSIEEVKRDNMVKDGIIKDLEIKKRRWEYLDPTEVKTLLQTISTSQAAVLKRLPAEMPARLAGKSTPEIEIELSKWVCDVIAIFRTSLDNWK
jgi:hypothetical protein